MTKLSKELAISLAKEYAEKYNLKIDVTDYNINFPQVSWSISFYNLTMEYLFEYFKKFDSILISLPEYIINLKDSLGQEKIYFNEVNNSLKVTFTNYLTIYFNESDIVIEQEHDVANFINWNILDSSYELGHQFYKGKIKLSKKLNKNISQEDFIIELKTICTPDILQLKEVN